MGALKPGLQAYADILDCSSRRLARLPDGFVIEQW